VPDRIQNHFLKRNCDFRYRIDKKSGEKTYHRKDLSFKVEAFDRINADASQGVKKGHKDLNLAAYIGRGLVTECLQLDKNEQVYMTVRIAVSPISATDKDITTLSLLATQRKQTTNRSTTGGNTGEEEDEDSDSSYQETTGKDARAAFMLYNDVYKSDKRKKKVVEEKKADIVKGALFGTSSNERSQEDLTTIRKLEETEAKLAEKSQANMALREQIAKLIKDRDSKDEEISKL
jgi:hypothetical protein